MSHRERIFEAALEYIRLGWSVLPLLGKSPVVAWKKYMTERPTRLHWDVWFREHNRQSLVVSGVGLVTGPVSKVYAVDLDSKEAEKSFFDLLGGPPQTLNYKTPRGSRYLFKSEKTLTGWKEQSFEFFGFGGQVVLPPSLHPNKMTYEWNPHASPQEVQFGELPSCLETPPATRNPGNVPPLSPTHLIKEGQRNSTLFKYAGALLRVGVPSDKIRSCLDVFNEMCLPPLREEELDKITQSIERYRRLAHHAEKHPRHPGD